MSCGWQMFFSGWALLWTLVSPLALYYLMVWPVRWRRAAGTQSGRFDQILNTAAAWTFMITYVSFMIALIAATIFRVGQHFPDGFLHLVFDGGSCNHHSYGGRPGVPAPIMAGALVGAALSLPMWLLWAFFEDVVWRLVSALMRYFAKSGLK